MNPLSADRQPGLQTFAFSSFGLQIFISLWIFRKPSTTDKACNIVEPSSAFLLFTRKRCSSNLIVALFPIPSTSGLTTFFRYSVSLLPAD